ncbi:MULTISPECIES: hypothetical protein [unclassified Bacillus (in: firmicutes)]|uniref:hypothetical protein n=1 Tax=unclassified Bacillus (in: firmicutes) TaxID=185979 RepID=UPI0008EE0FBF|nr:MULTISPECIES: hypothetical protein [unclassified Bacillus (in: firmicutes)]SFA87890.1 hypothetical protein SAMN02799634_102273 [Bacillus sp. UNCCL13]SFQ84446.1 hypothetical protein SAMN04488577_2392 [Bacillus sp. cl95]
MNILFGFIFLCVFLYTVGFSWTLWKEKNKLGAFAVFVLSAVIVTLPFITIFE